MSTIRDTLLKLMSEVGEEAAKRLEKILVETSDYTTVTAQAAIIAAQAEETKRLREENDRFRRESTHLREIIARDQKALRNAGLECSADATSWIWKPSRSDHKTPLEIGDAIHQAAQAVLSGAALPPAEAVAYEPKSAWDNDTVALRLSNELQMIIQAYPDSILDPTKEIAKKLREGTITLPEDVPQIHYWKTNAGYWKREHEATAKQLMAQRDALSEKLGKEIAAANEKIKAYQVDAEKLAKAEAAINPLKLIESAPEFLSEIDMRHPLAKVSTLVYALLNLCASRLASYNALEQEHNKLKAGADHERIDLIHRLLNEVGAPLTMKAWERVMWLKATYELLKENSRRWESGMRSMASFLIGPDQSFEIPQIVEMVRRLAKCDGNGDPIAGERAFISTDKYHTELAGVVRSDAERLIAVNRERDDLRQRLAIEQGQHKITQEKRKEFEGHADRMREERDEYQKKNGELNAALTEMQQSANRATEEVVRLTGEMDKQTKEYESERRRIIAERYAFQERLRGVMTELLRGDCSILDAEADAYTHGRCDPVPKAEAVSGERIRLRAEVEMLRGVGCTEDGDGPCGVCIKCLRVENTKLREKIQAAADERDNYKRRKDDAYTERNRVVAAFARLATIMDWPVAVTRTAIEGWSADWHGCVFIDTPNGQVSWHFHDSHAAFFKSLPQGPVIWDGHTTAQKYERLEALVALLVAPRKV